MLKSLRLGFKEQNLKERKEEREYVEGFYKKKIEKYKL